MNPVSEGDVIQFDPETSSWGPLLAIVTEVRQWGVICYAMVPETRGEAPSRMYNRVQNGQFVRIGAAEWLVALRNDHGPDHEK